MSSKSLIVSNIKYSGVLYNNNFIYHRYLFGVIPKNENKIKEMVQILSHLHQYIPQVEYEVQDFVPELNESVMIHKAKTHTVMLGGDQLSVVRTRSALNVKSNAETPSKRLEGIIPTVEDWHAKF